MENLKNKHSFIYQSLSKNGRKSLFYTTLIVLISAGAYIVSFYI